MKKLYYLITFIHLIFAIPALAQTNTWTGNAGDDDWHKACNWSLNNVPTCSHDVVVPGTSQPSITGIAHCNSITISTGTGAVVNLNSSGGGMLDIASLNGGACNGTRLVNTSPVSTAASSITGTNTICTGGSTTLTRSGGSLGVGGSWQWYSGSCGGTSAGTGNSINVSPTSTTTYYLRAEGTCNTTTCVSRTVTVQSQPTAPTTVTKAPNVTNVCTNTSGGLSGAASGGTNRGCTHRVSYQC